MNLRAAPISFSLNKQTLTIRDYSDEKKAGGALKVLFSMGYFFIVRFLRKPIKQPTDSGSFTEG